MPHSTPSGVELYACIPPVETGGYSYWSPPDFLNINDIALKGDVVTAAIKFFYRNCDRVRRIPVNYFRRKQNQCPIAQKNESGASENITDWQSVICPVAVVPIIAAHLPIMTLF
jgi:hypothetical protein